MCFMKIQQIKNGILLQPLLFRNILMNYTPFNEEVGEYSAYTGIPRLFIIIGSLYNSKEEVVSEAFHNHVFDNYRVVDEST